MNDNNTTTDIVVRDDDTIDDETANALVALHDDIITRMVDLHEMGEPLRAQMAFHTELNKPCPQSFIKRERGVDTLPISYVESMLDAYFIGNWHVRDFRFQIVVNEIIGTIQLVATHPVTGHEIQRTGAASIQIMVHKDSDFTDVTNKKANALEMGFPKLKSMCIKNAAKSLGKRFGRDLNREQIADAFEVVKTSTDVLDAILHEHEQQINDNEND